MNERNKLLFEMNVATWLGTLMVALGFYGFVQGIVVRNFVLGLVFEGLVLVGIVSLFNWGIMFGKRLVGREGRFAEKLVRGDA